MQCCICPYLDGVGQEIVNWSIEDYDIVCTMIHYLPLQCLHKAIYVQRFLPPILVGHEK